MSVLKSKTLSIITKEFPVTYHTFNIQGKINIAFPLTETEEQAVLVIADEEQSKYSAVVVEKEGETYTKDSNNIEDIITFIKNYK